MKTKGCSTERKDARAKKQADYPIRPAEEGNGATATATAIFHSHARVQKIVGKIFTPAAGHEFVGIGALLALFSPWPNAAGGAECGRCNGAMATR